MSDDIVETRRDMAAVFRWSSRLGLSEGICNHYSFAIDENHFDLLIADIVMPGIDGIELARRACLELPGLRVMFITGFAAVALKAQTLSHFGTDSKADAKVLSKPFHLKDLVEQVEHALAA